MAFVDAVKELAQRRRHEGAGGRARRRERQRGASRPTDLIDVAARAPRRFYRAQLKERPRAIAYLKERGLTGEIAARFGIGYAPGRLAEPRGGVPRL